jgi:GT2 family glycosyltransferase
LFHEETIKKYISFTHEMIAGKGEACMKSDRILYDIIIPVYGQPELSFSCLESINRYVTPRVHVIIVNNNSDRDTIEVLNKASSTSPHEFTIIQNSQNLGFPRAANQGLKAGNGDYACVLNNDTVVHKGWLTYMVKILNMESDIGLVNPDGTRGYRRFNSKGPFPYIEMGTLSGYCILGKRSLWNQVDGFDEAYSPFLWEDIDLCRKVHRLGYRCVLAPKAYVQHERSSSLKKIKSSYRREIEEKNMDYYYAKWGKSLRVACFLKHKWLKTRAQSYVCLIHFLRKMANLAHHVEIYLDSPQPNDIFTLAKIPRHVNISAKKRVNILGLPWLVRWFEGRFRSRKDDLIITDSYIMFHILTALRAKSVYLLEGECLVSNKGTHNYPLRWDEFLDLHHKQGLLSDVIM